MNVGMNLLAPENRVALLRKTGVNPFTPTTVTKRLEFGAVVWRTAPIIQTNTECVTVSANIAGCLAARFLRAMIRGAITRWIGTCIDIDESKRNVQQTELLSRELSHRIKNIFAVIAGLIGLSTYRDPVNEEFGNRLAGRISALGRAHDFARPHSERSMVYGGLTGLEGMLAELLSPYRGVAGERIQISGEDIPIDERSATPIALVIHELATNAVKYGALSDYEGSVEVTISQDQDNVVVGWKETGGPPVTEPPSREGFGTQLSDISIRDQLGGNIERKWLPKGLEVTLTIAASRLRAEPATN
jgi:two-component sensor histidine kinase